MSGYTGAEDLASALKQLQRDRAEESRNKINCDAEWNESSHPRNESGQFGSGGGGSTAPAQKKVSVNDAKKIIESKTGHQLHAALKSPNLDPKIRKLIEKDLDDRANRGLSLDRPNT